MDSSRPKLSGIVPPMVTPLLDIDRLDEPGLERLINRMVEGGVAGIFVLGTTGEAPSLSYRLRRELVARSAKIINGRVPMLVGITDTSIVQSLEVADAAAEAGADALVLATPYYFPAGQTELLGYVRRICERLPLPLMLYNMPSLTKIWFELDTLRQLSDLPNIIGIKDSSGDLDYFASIVRLKEHRPDWSILIGPEQLLPQAMALGGDGGVHGGGNCFPRLFTELYTAVTTGDNTRAQRLSSIVDKFQAIYDIGKYGSRFIKATKSALSVLGVCSDCLAEPFNHFLPPEREQVVAILNSLAELDSDGVLGDVS